MDNFYFAKQSILTGFFMAMEEQNISSTVENNSGSSGFDTKEYIQHHLRYLQVDWTTGVIQNSKNVHNINDYNLCLKSNSEAECLKTMKATDCYFSDLGQSKCVPVIEQGVKEKLVDMNIINLDSSFISFGLGFFILACFFVFKHFLLPSKVSIIFTVLIGGV